VDVIFKTDVRVLVQIVHHFQQNHDDRVIAYRCASVQSRTKTGHVAFDTFVEKSDESRKELVDTGCVAKGS
jgi:hypothetical protein